MRRGMSPILGFVLLTLLVMGMAGTATVFLQQQQQALDQRLGEALENDLELESVACEGDQIRIQMQNIGADLSGVEDVRVIVLQGDSVQADMINQTVPFDGAFTEPNTTGQLNATTGGTFVSGEIYTVRLTFPFGEYVKEGTCSGGYDWWDRDWQYRQQLRLTNDDQPVTGDQIAFDIDTTEQVQTAMMRGQCADLQVVDDNETLQTFVEDCGTGSTTVSFPIDLDPGEKRVSTYLYYGNPDARDVPSAPSPDDGTVDIEIGTIEEQ